MTADHIFEKIKLIIPPYNDEKDNQIITGRSAAAFQQPTKR